MLLRTDILQETVVGCPQRDLVSTIFVYFWTVRARQWNKNAALKMSEMWTLKKVALRLTSRTRNMTICAIPLQNQIRKYLLACLSYGFDVLTQPRPQGFLREKPWGRGWYLPCYKILARFKTFFVFFSSTIHKNHYIFKEWFSINSFFASNVIYSFQIFALTLFLVIHTESV